MQAGPQSEGHSDRGADDEVQEAGGGEEDRCEGRGAGQGEDGRAGEGDGATEVSQPEAEGGEGDSDDGGLGVSWQFQTQDPSDVLKPNQQVERNKDDKWDMLVVGVGSTSGTT